MINWQIICEFSDLINGIEETETIAFAGENDAEYECEQQAMMRVSRYNIMPKKKGKYRWEFREPGELLVVIRAEKIPDE